METKSRARKEALRLRNTMSAEEVQNKSAAICNRLKDSLQYRYMNTIFVYAALGNEVDLKHFVECAWKDGRHIYFPKVIGNDMEFYEVTSYEQLQEGYFHVPEPKTATDPFDMKKLHAGETIYVLTPGVAFLKSGARLGYGKGFYDRYFDRLQKSGIDFVPVGVAYHMQLSVSFVEEAFDYKMITVFTEKEEVWCDV